MELRHLRYFVAVAEELHFGRAAERLNIAQPPLSQQIRSLEEELGVTLFARTQRSVALTPAGQAFLPEAYKTLAQADQAVQVAQRVARGERGHLRIGFVSSVAYGGLPEAIRAFRTRKPDISLTLRELTSQELLAQVEAGELDLGFIRSDEATWSPTHRGHFRQRIVYREPFVVALPDKHPLAKLQAVPLIRLRDEDFVIFPRASNPTLYDHLIRQCRDVGFEPRIVQEANLMQTLVSLVAAGLGVTLAPASLKNMKRHGVVYKKVTYPEILSDLVAVWRFNEESAIREAFMDVVIGTATWGVPSPL